MSIGHYSKFEFEEKTRNGSRRLARLSLAEFTRLLLDNAALVASRLAIVNCRRCGRRFPVNKQDLHQVRACRKGFGCNA